MKYYFISYNWRVLGNPHAMFANRLINKHPLQWQVEHNGMDREEYFLLSWQEVSQKEYEEYNLKIG